MTGDQSRGSLRDAIIGRRLTIIGIAVGALAMCAWLFGLWQALHHHTPGIGVFFWYAALGTSSSFLLFKGRQYLTRSKSAELLLESGPPVVLLRPFETDATAQKWRVRVKWNSSDDYSFPESKYFTEESLAEAVRPIGPLVAVEPGKALPSPGAARFRETDQTWKDRVVDLLRRARLVILVPGTSEALLWETTTAFQQLKPQQLLILGLGTDTPREHEALSQMFKKATGQEFPDRRYLGRAESTGVTFDGGWAPRILRLHAPYWRSHYADLHYGLEPVFRANDIEWHPPPLLKQEVGVIMVWLIMLGATLLGPSGLRLF